MIKKGNINVYDDLYYGVYSLSLSKDYSYPLNESDEVIIKYLEELGHLKTYFHVKKHPGLGLDYCGTTIIPPSSLKEFKKIIVRANKQFKSNELDKLINKINIAIKENKYVIHYGI